jgi:putative sigma-54 modulation protein
MKVIVKARHMTLTPALRQHAEEKLGNALMHVFDRPALKIEIELSDIGNVRTGMNMECRATVSMPRGKTVNITEVTDDMYKSIDLCHDRLLVQVKRERERKRNTKGQRKAARLSKEDTAREALTVAPEAWEVEVKEYERSTANT